jgi:hypothetical protein
VRPLGLHRPAPSNPILRDYNVYRISIADFEAAGSRSHYRLCWGGQAHRTGVPYTVRSEGFILFFQPLSAARWGPALGQQNELTPIISFHDLKSLEFSSQAFRGAVDRRDTDRQPIVETDRQRRKRNPARSDGPK